MLSKFWPRHTKNGRKPSNTFKIRGYGNPLFDKAYSAMLDLKPVDMTKMKLDCKQIMLIPIGEAEEEE